jgi:predicted PurR-regulated permease PerM
MKLPRSIAVLGAVSLAVTIAFSLAAMVMIEVNQLANDLPSYQSTLSEKIHNLRDRIGSVGVLKNASSLLKDLNRELKSPGRRHAATTGWSLHHHGNRGDLCHLFPFQREDLRDPLIRLLGSEDLERTTAALDDAAQRLGRFFLTQLVLNATFGVVIGLAWLSSGSRLRLFGDCWRWFFDLYPISAPSWLPVCLSLWPLRSGAIGR